MENHRDMESIIGKMAVSLKVILRTDSEMEREYGKRHKVNLIPMMESICMIKNMEKEYSHGPMAVFLKALIKMITDKAMGKCSGSMALYLKDNGSMDSNLVKVTTF